MHVSVTLVWHEYCTKLICMSLVNLTSNFLFPLCHDHWGILIFEAYSNELKIEKEVNFILIKSNM